MTERSVDKKTKVRSTEEALKLIDLLVKQDILTKHETNLLREALMSVPDGAQSRSDEEQPAPGSHLTDEQKAANGLAWLARLEALREEFAGLAEQPAQRKPLTLGQKQRLWSSVGDKPTLKDRVNAYGTAIEAAHGIKEKNT